MRRIVAYTMQEIFCFKYFIYFCVFHTISYIVCMTWQLEKKSQQSLQLDETIVPCKLLKYSCTRFTRRESDFPWSNMILATRIIRDLDDQKGRALSGTRGLFLYFPRAGILNCKTPRSRGSNWFRDSRFDLNVKQLLPGRRASNYFQAKLNSARSRPKEDLPPRDVRLIPGEMARSHYTDH